MLASAIPPSGWATNEAEPDVVVVGAGAAGLAAARSILESGHSVTLIEARNRIGGRTWTESDTFGFPYDRGAQWLHHASSNVWISYAQRHGFGVYPDDGTEYLFRNRRALRERDLNKYYAALEAFFERTREESRGKPDRPVSDYLRDEDRYADTIEARIVHDWIGADAEDLSTEYLLFDGENNDWMVREGLGTLIAHYGRDVPVHLDTSAQEIRWGGKGVAVVTNAGVIRASAVVITASTGVLSEGAIKFTPRLPSSKVEAFHAFPMGSYNHISLLYSEDVFGLGADQFVTPFAEGSLQPGVYTNIKDTGLVEIYVGGSFGRELEFAGPAVAEDYGAKYIDDLLGTDASSKLVKSTFSQWSLDPWTRGSYAYARVGGLEYREALRAPIANRVFFAGDACTPEGFSSVSRAYETGIEVAAKIKTLLAAK